jgi:hypothetical protein
VFDGLSTPAISYFRLHPTWSLLGQSVARTKPSVRIAGMDLPAKAIKEGNFENVDLTLLSINQQKLPIYLQMRRMPLCEKNPWPGKPVIVAIPEETARSRIISPLALPFSVPRKFSTLISDVARSRNSGSGVFDAGNKCLLGIVSRKFFVRPNSGDAEGEEKDIAKYFVPTSTIRIFIPMGEDVLRRATRCPRGSRRTRHGVSPDPRFTLSEGLIR